jgi:hypothetical protein
MRVGILDLQAYPASNAWEFIDDFLTHKQYISLTCQVISVWCRRMGHQTYYAAYYGWGDPKACLPKDLDIVFISAHTYLSPLAYALSRAFQRDGVRTVIGGPHGRAYPQDSLRFFDLAVGECDAQLVADILAGEFAPGSVVSAQKAFDEIPFIEERLPELRKSAFLRGRPYPGSFVPMLASMGCPFHCDFCVDWNNPYRPLSYERLAEDLRFASHNLPGVLLGFNDLNFGIRFDELLEVFEAIPPEKRNQIGIECSLTTLRPERLPRLKAVQTRFVLPSIESWNGDYASKSGNGKEGRQDKFKRLVETFNQLGEMFPYVGTNFILGLDQDVGDEPFEMTAEFIRQTPAVWSVLHIPMPYGGTPLYARLLREERILSHMPFMFYKVPYLAIVLKNYDPVTYYKKMGALFDLTASGPHYRRRLKLAKHPLIYISDTLQTVTARRRYHAFRAILKRLQEDRQYLAFHTGQIDKLPEIYVRTYRRVMGAYAELVPVEDMTHPIL